MNFFNKNRDKFVGPYLYITIVNCLLLLIII